MSHRSQPDVPGELVSVNSKKGDGEIVCHPIVKFISKFGGASISRGASKLFNALKRLFPSFLILVFIACIDPFGLKSNSVKVSATLFQKIFSSVNYSSAAQPSISVFLINDEYLKERRLRWPLDYDSQFKIYSEILSQKPKALFLNLLYSHTDVGNDEISEFISSLKDVAEDNGNIPIIVQKIMEGEGFDCLANYEQVPSVVDQPLLPLFENSFLKKSYTKWHNCNSSYPLFLSGNNYHPSPAFALYAIYCENNPGRCHSDFSDGGFASLANNFKSPMDVQWGVNLDSKYQNTLEEMTKNSCQSSVQTFPEKVAYIWGQAMHLLGQVSSNSTERGADAKCPYAETFYANWFSDMPVWVEELFSKMISGRYVFVGASVSANPDWVASPVNGSIAGVYFHAMAFDNLLVYGDRYIRSMPKLFSLFLEALMLLLLIVLMESYFVFVVDSEESSITIATSTSVDDGIFLVSNNKTHMLMRLLPLVTVYLLLPLFLVVAASFLFVSFGFTPFDWVAILCAACGVDMLANRKKIRRYVQYA